jgi:hypothetical protein
LLFNLLLTAFQIHLRYSSTVMKKLLVAALALTFQLAAFAQETETDKAKSPKKKDWSKVSLANRPGDHFMIQLGMAGWSGAPDSMNIKGLSKNFNFYFIFDFPFKTDPRFSVGIGPGIGSESISFRDTYIGIKDPTSTLRFQDLSDTNHFKKYRLNTTFLEAPVELRFNSNPLGKGLKLAVGLKVGTLLDARTKGREWVNKDEQTLNDFSEKIKKKDFFSKNRLTATFRVGTGVFSLYGSYQFGGVLREGVGPVVRPWAAGICISGL